jgi:hypothetical protein
MLFYTTLFAVADFGSNTSLGFPDTSTVTLPHGFWIWTLTVILVGSPNSGYRSRENEKLLGVEVSVILTARQSLIVVHDWPTISGYRSSKRSTPAPSIP